MRYLINRRDLQNELLVEILELNGESPLLNDLLDVSDSRKYELFQRAIRRMAEILSS